MIFLLLFLSFAQDAELLKNWTQVAVIPVQGDLHHVQGIDVDGNSMWISSVDAKAGKGYLSRFELPSGKLVVQVEVQQGNRVHPGGISLDGDSIWVPVAEYKRVGKTTIERRNRMTLAVISSFEVEDHIGCLAVSRNELIGGNWDSRLIYRWSRDGKQMAKEPNASGVGWQDIKVVDGMLLGSGVGKERTGVVEWLSLPDYSSARRVEVHKTDRGVSLAHEGMTYRGGRLYFLPEDSPSRLFVFTP